MARLLSRVAEHHGSVRDYVVSIGVSNALLARLETVLLSEADR